MNEITDPFENLKLPQQINISIEQAYSEFKNYQKLNPTETNRSHWLREKLKSQDISVTFMPVIAQGQQKVIGVNLEQSQGLGIVFGLETDEIYTSGKPVYATLEPTEDQENIEPIEVEVVPIKSKPPTLNSVAVTQSCIDLLQSAGSELRITQVYHKLSDINLDSLSRSL